MFPFSGEINGDAYNDEWEFNGPDSGQKREFIKDPLYYHHRVYVTIKHETEKALLLQDEYGIYWIPRKLLIMDNEHCHQYNKFKIKYLEEK